MRQRGLFLGLLVGAIAAVPACSDNGSSSDASTDGPDDHTCPPGPLGEGGCNAEEPTVGGCCTAGENLCTAKGEDPCCQGYAWECEDGAWAKNAVGCACMATDAGEDSGPLDASSDGPGATGCGKATCKTGDICVVDSTASGACESMDGGMCPKGTVKEGTCCLRTTTTRTCQPLPHACKGTLKCDCAKDACGETGASCSVSGSTLTCSVESD